jgi:hypothetical protein
VNASPSQEDSYLSPHKDFKLFACSVQDLWWSKVELTNCDTAVIAAGAAAAAAVAH